MNTSIHWGNRSHIGKESYLKNTIKESNQKGFTLVELIVVLVIIAILAGIAVPVVIGFVDRAREKEFIGNAEISLSATQAVLNDVYNDGLGYLPITKRIEAYNAAQAGNIENDGKVTGFKVWTKRPLVHGTTHATNNEIASFVIGKALFVSNGQAAVYDGKDWTLYDDEEDAKAACQGFGKEIVIWPVEQAYTDDAYNPANLVQGEVEVSEEEIQTQTSMLTVKILSVENLVTLEKIPQVANTIQADVDLTEPADRIRADIEAKMDGYTVNINKQYVQHEEQIGWGYEYKTSGNETKTGLQNCTLMGVAQFVADNKDTLKGQGVKEIEFTPSVSPKRVTVRVAFESAGLLTVTGNEKDYVYNIVTQEMVAPVYNIVTQEMVAPGPKDIKVGNTSDTVTFAGNWAVESGESYQFYSLQGIGEYVTNVAQAAAAGYETNDFDDPINVTFLAAADVQKKVYLSDKKTGNAYSGKVTFNGEPMILAATVTKNELQDTVKIGDQVIGQYTYKKNEAGDVTDTSFAVSNSYNLLNGVTMAKDNELKTKWWFIYDSDAKGTIASTTNYGKTTDDNPTVAVFERLYAPNNDSMGEVAEVDLSALNALLKYTDVLTEQSPILQKLYYLAGGNNASININVDSTDSYLAKIRKIEFITGVATPPSTSGMYREVCLSVTEIPAESNGFLKRKKDGENYIYDIDDENRDVDYPNYIVAYSVKNGDGYDIFVFAEDDSEMKAKGSLQGMFACCENMATNTMVNHMNTEGIISTHLMFYNCKELKNLAFDKIDTKSAIKMSYMFKNCNRLNQPTEGLAIHIDSAQTIQNMFEGCANLKDITLEGNGDSPLGNTSAGNVFASSGLTTLCLRNLNFTKFEQGADADNAKPSNKLENGLYALTSSAIAAGNLDSVTFENVKADKIQSARSLLDGATELTSADLSGLTLPNNKSLKSLFNGCTILPGSGIKLGSNLIYKGEEGEFFTGLNAASMFNSCKGLDSDPAGIEGFSDYVSHAKYFDWMFENCDNLTTATVNIQSAISLKYMFSGCGSLTAVVFEGNATDCLAADAPTCPLGNTADKSTDMFKNTNVTNVTIQNIVFANFQNGASTSNEAYGLMHLLSGRKANLTTVTISNVGFPNVQSVATTFREYANLNKVVFEKVNMPSLTRMKWMFYKSYNLKTVEFNGFNAKPVNMTGLLEECKTLTSFKVDNDYAEGFTFDTSRVTDMNQTFKNCQAITKLDLSMFNTSSVTTHEELFRNCFCLTELDTHSFTSPNCTNFKRMFDACYSLEVIDLSNLNPANLSEGNFEKMFGTTDTNPNTNNRDSALRTIYASFELIGNTKEIFGEHLNLVGGYGTSLSEKREQDKNNYKKSKYACVDDGTGHGGYFTIKQEP
ncbi:MAG: BspA family leucine-rich repeat surface protein [Lachnospiraceae bacterium]|nr:BspA family leucine-rich repeat surface protein [Lachnospiraceae bacterium]